MVKREDKVRVVGKRRGRVSRERREPGPNGASTGHWVEIRPLSFCMCLLFK